MKKICMFLIALATAFSASAALSVKQAGGWLETAWLEFEGLSANYAQYNAYVSTNGTAWTAVDGPLVRSYGTYGRVDVLGLAAGNYFIKVVPQDAAGNEVAADAVQSNALVVKAHDRNGFAHFNRTDKTQGVGAYNDNGTLKNGARVLYVTAANASTVQLEMTISSKGATATFSGVQRILNAYQKGCETRPLAIRILGCVKVANLDSLGSSEEGVQIKGKESFQQLNLTIEGVGNDAAIHGFGILCRNTSFVEFRNFGILNCMDDCLGFDTDNSHCWIHNIDFFYGKTGSAADQAKGDGTVDLKAGTKNVTISYCHFFDSGKSSLCGMKSETAAQEITYHHNWFDHSDSRHPRIRTMSVHVYNNYFDGNSKYGVGVTCGASAFVENNYFRNCKYPMMISMQGTDAQGDGTFSGETGGVIKAYGNSMTGQVGYRTYAQYGNNCDAYEVANRADQVPSSVVAVSGGTTYNNFDQKILSTITPEPAANVPATVKGEYGAGRCQKGDIAYTFSGSEDTNYGVIADMKNTVSNYNNTAFAGVVGDTSSMSGNLTPSQPGEDNPTDPSQPANPSTGDYECYFTGGKPSSTFYTITGNYSNSKGSVTYNGTTYAECLKMESATTVSFTTTEELDFVLVMNASGNIKVDGNKLVAGADGVIRVTLQAGSHAFTKADSNYLFYINATSKGTSGGNDPSNPDDGDNNPSNPDDGENNPSNPDDGENNPSNPDDGDNNPSNPDDGGNNPSNPDDDKNDPEQSTDINDQLGNVNQPKKVCINGKIYIVNGEEMYTTSGVRVK